MSDEPKKTRRGGYILDPFRGEQRVLYAVAVNLWRHGQWSAHIHYVHAHTAREARRFFLHTRPGPGRFVAVAPAVGFFALDDNGDHLSADPFDSDAAAASTTTRPSSTRLDGAA